MLKVSYSFQMICTKSYNSDQFCEILEKDFERKNINFLVVNLATYFRQHSIPDSRSSEFHISFHFNSSISPVNGNIKIIKTSHDDTVMHIIRMSQLHDKLNDIIETINFCYSFQVQK